MMMKIVWYEEAIIGDVVVAAAAVVASAPWYVQQFQMLAELNMRCNALDAINHFQPLHCLLQLWLALILNEAPV